MKSSDPGTMTATERFAEIAEILAAGFQRMLVKECKALQGEESSQNPLDETAQPEAPWVSKAMNPETQEPAA